MFGIPAFIYFVTLFSFFGMPEGLSFPLALLLNLIIVLRRFDKEAALKKSPEDTSSKEYLARYMPKV